jgi:aspartyl-tRNA(Asn)/glutamyl-tRNA(Gln) amidotransferase subunit A
MQSLIATSLALARGETTSRALTENCLSAIDDPAGEGARTFTKVYRETALATADYHDKLRAHGVVVSPIAGIPISVKDLFDIAGDTTLAASRALVGTPAAAADAPAIARLRAAGAVIVGRTNMTEFAYGGIGMNVHYGTPRSPWQRGTGGATDGHVPGGSSSGAAVSVTDGMAFAGIGSDTGGSTRIPAAFCGIVGFKPTQARIPRDGAIPLSTSLDSIGPLGRTVADCHLVDALLAGDAWAPLNPLPLKGLRLAVPVTVMHESLDSHVSQSFANALNQLARAGAIIAEMDMPEFAQILSSYSRATFSGAEAGAWHRALLAEKGELYDWRVAKRLKLTGNVNAADYIELVALRERVQAAARIRTAGFDALLCPTAPITPPRIDTLEANEAEFFRVQPLTVRNCQMFNFLNRPAISLPCHRFGDAPVGLMVGGAGAGAADDARVFAIAQSIEVELAGWRG